MQTAFQTESINFLLLCFFLLMFLQKADIISSLQRTASSQSILTTQSMSPICKGKGKSTSRDGLHQRTLFPFLSIGCTEKFKMTQENRLRQMALKLLGMYCMLYLVLFYPFSTRILQANVFVSILIFID